MNMSPLAGLRKLFLDAGAINMSPLRGSPNSLSVRFVSRLFQTVYAGVHFCGHARRAACPLLLTRPSAPRTFV